MSAIRFVLISTFTLLLAACGAVSSGNGATGEPAAGDGGETGETIDPKTLRPPGPDTDQPHAIDTGDRGEETPGSYKGLWQRLTDSGEPEITPVDGVIGVVCVGMSNGRQECDDFIAKLTTSFAGQVHASVKVVNCAVGSHAIERWISPADDATLWDACVNTKLPAAGVRPDQVRVLWHKAANQFTTTGGELPPPYPDERSDFFTFKKHLGLFAARVPVKFPSVQAVYVSSRSFGGFADSPGRGEPLSFEEGHALNAWLAENPEVGGIWFGWGPYLWAPDCASGGTNGGGVCYERSDFVADGVHPAQGGKDKISQLLHQRLSQHRWYRP